MSPVEAIGVLKDKSVDVVITEWALRPMEGGAFIRHIRSMEGIRNPQLPVIVLAASSDLDTVAAVRDAGANEFLMRPLVLERLLTRLTHAMTQPQPFVRTKTYIGPERRHKERPTDGPDRRGDAAVAKPPSRLAKALAERVRRDGGQTIDELVRIGERVIAEEGERYREVRRRDLKNIITLTKQLKDIAASAAALVQAIHDTSHDLKGMGQTFGYPLLTEAGEVDVQAAGRPAAGTRHYPAHHPGGGDARDGHELHRRQGHSRGRRDRDGAHREFADPRREGGGAVALAPL